MNKIIIDSFDGYKLSLNEYLVSNPKGAYVVFHGMEEHKERYNLLAERLNLLGYNVLTCDMRGHGYDCQKLGYFLDKDGYKALIEDEKVIIRYASSKYGFEKINIFAHSMGTIITRNFLMQNSNLVDNVILSGYPCPVPIAPLGAFLASLVKLFKGSEGKSKLLQNLATGSFNKQIENPKTNLDWLSYNEENVANYLKDPYCGHGFLVSAYKDLFVLVARMGKASNYHNVNEDVKFLLLRGEDDPCVGGIKGHEASLNILKEAGFKNFKLQAFPHMRHEILNEDNKEDVYKKIEEFIKEA